VGKKSAYTERVLYRSERGREEKQAEVRPSEYYFVSWAKGGGGFFGLGSFPFEVVKEFRSEKGGNR